MFGPGRSWGDKQGRAGVRHTGAVPDTPRHNGGLSGRKFYRPLPIPVVQEENQPTVEAVEQLVAQRVALPPRPIRRVVENRKYSAIV